MLAVVDEWLLAAGFDWIPAAFLETAGVLELDGTPLVVTMVLSFVFVGFVGPIVEEVYFRGFLLPRIPAAGRGKPIVNAVLFSVYHLWSPWKVLTRIVGVLPFIGVVWWKRNLKLGILVHCLLNCIGILALLALVL